MTFDGGDGRRHTLHGEPVPLSDYRSAYPAAPPPPPPRRGNGGLVVAIVAVAVVVVGLGAFFAWLVLRDDPNGGSAAAESVPQTVFQNQTPVPQTTAHQTPIPQTPVPQTPVPQTPVPQTPVPQSPGPQPSAVTPTPPASSGTWYAQFGAFNQYDNAQAEVARHYGAVILPGADFGLSSRYVVVRPTASEAEARQVCSHFAEGQCYVRRR